MRESSNNPIPTSPSGQTCGSCRHNGISAYDGLLVCMIDPKTRPVIDKNKEACGGYEPRDAK